jgi:E3 ubiquitin-protein ligase ZNF598
LTHPQRRQEFPDLVPTAIGSGFAGVASGRVLNAKSATALRARGTGPQSQIWDRVAQAAGSSSAGQRYVPGASAPAPAPAPTAERFPALGPTAGPGGRGPPGVARTAWSASAAGAPPPAPAAPVIRSVPGPAASASAGKKKAQPVFSAAAFPTLPSLRNILVEPEPVANPWAGGGSSAVETSHAPLPADEAVPAGKGKKKGKGKQMLFTMGTMPS